MAYWEGCIRLKGEKKSKPIDGFGYMELTGQAATSAVFWGQKNELSIDR
jgi:Lipocalin-like domain